jgi:hypothetical protein
MKRRVELLTGAVLLLVTNSAVALVFDFDDGVGGISGTVGSLNATDGQAPSILFTNGSGDQVSVTAGISTGNLCCGDETDINNVRPADVYWDNDPAGSGGLGVVSGLNGDTDNIEGSITSYDTDEVLFFDFGNIIELVNVLLNGDHTDLLDNDGEEQWALWTSVDGLTWDSISGNLFPADRETLQLGNTLSRYLAVSAVGPSGQTGGYIEAITYSNSVPEPTTIALLGAGLLGIGFARRRAHTA